LRETVSNLGAIMLPCEMSGDDRILATLPINSCPRPIASASKLMVTNYAEAATREAPLRRACDPECSGALGITRIAA
jgi:hypothetical protein